MAAADAKNPDPAPVPPGRDLTVEASFKFTFPDFPIKDVKLVTSDVVDDVRLMRAVLRQARRGDYNASPYQMPKPEGGTPPAAGGDGDQAQGNADAKAEPVPPQVNLMVVKLAQVPANKVIQPVTVHTMPFDSRNPKTGAYVLTGDSQATFWAAHVGDLSGDILIGFPPNSDGSFYYYNPNTVDVIVDLIVGTASGQGKSDHKKTQEDDEDEPDEAEAAD